LFITLAEHYIDKKIVRNRWDGWLKYEKELMNEMEIRGDRIH
jgi:tRNA-(ms[2]io[6]A)-hydroxylase